MRPLKPLAAATIKALMALVERESDPAAPSYIVAADDTSIEDGGRYGDPFQGKPRPDFLQQAYDDLPDMSPGGELKQ